MEIVSLFRQHSHNEKLIFVMAKTVFDMDLTILPVAMKIDYILMGTKDLPLYNFLDSVIYFKSLFTLTIAEKLLQFDNFLFGTNFNSD